jgi:hypothetical protein
MISITGLFGAKFNSNGDFYVRHTRYKHINKFGYNTSVGGTYAPVTDLGTSVLPSSAGVVSVVSASGNDDGSSPVGTGARTLEIQGLDANYNELTETITLTGTSASVTNGEFLRIFRMRVATAGSAETNVGNITASIGGQAVARVTEGKGQTLMAVYTVPAGYRAHLLKLQVSLSKNQEANAQLRSKSATGAWQVKGEFGTFSAVINYDYPVPLIFTEKTDIQIRSKAGATSEMGAIFDLILEDLS